MGRERRGAAPLAHSAGAEAIVVSPIARYRQQEQQEQQRRRWAGGIDVGDAGDVVGDDQQAGQVGCVRGASNEKDPAEADVDDAAGERRVRVVALRRARHAHLDLRPEVAGGRRAILPHRAFTAATDTTP